MSLAFGFALPHWQPLSGGFSPASLFAGGTAGAWYDPSDLSTMFTTSDGTTPVAMPGLGSAVSVGLMLDKSQGLVLGSELLADPGFDNASAWQSNVGVTISGGEAIWNTATNSVYVRQPLITTANTYYEFTVVCSSYTAGTVFVGIGAGGTNLTSFPINAVGTVRFRTNVGANSGTVWLLTPSGGAQLSITSFSVRQVSGNHAIAFNNTTARPELRARVNLLTYSEEFDNGVWVKNNATVSANAITAPDGTLTADQLSGNGILSDHRVNQNVAALAPATFSIYLKQGTERYGYLYILGRSATNDGSNAVYFDLQTGTITSSTGTDAVVPTITDVGNGWYRLTMGRSTAFSGSTQIDVRIGVANAANVQSSTASGHIYIWGADLRPANIGANVPAYQRIADANTYDTSGFPLYLFFDGIDDSMYTPASIPFATVTSDGQARRNLLSFPTVFNDPFWTVSGATVSANSTTAPDGTTTADTLTETAAAGSHQIYNTSQLLGVPTPLCMSVYVKPNGRTWVFLGDDGGGVFFNLAGAGSVGTQQAGRTGSISSVGDGWYRVVVTGNRPAVNDSVYIALCSADNTLSYTGNGTSGVFIWGAQFEAGSTATAFQNIGTDKVAVFAGVRALQTAVQVISELSSNSSTNNGSFVLYKNNSGLGFSSRGTSLVDVNNGSGSNTPISLILTGQSDISAPLMSLRSNGTQILSSTSSQGTGNYGTYPLYIGARNNSSLWFNGHLHSLIIAGSAVSAGNISATEQYIANKTGIQI